MLSALDQRVELCREIPSEHRLAQRRTDPSVGAVGTQFDDRALGEGAKRCDHQAMRGGEVMAPGGQRLRLTREVWPISCGLGDRWRWFGRTQRTPYRPGNMRDQRSRYQRDRENDRPEEQRRRSAQELEARNGIEDFLQPFEEPALSLRAEADRTRIFGAREDIIGELANRLVRHIRPATASAEWWRRRPPQRAPARLADANRILRCGSADRNSKSPAPPNYRCY